MVEVLPTAFGFASPGITPVRFSWRPAANDRSRREELHLLLLVLALGLTVILMAEVRKANRWQWLWWQSGRGTAARPGGGERAVARHGYHGERAGDTRGLAEDVHPTPARMKNQFFPGVMPSYLDSVRDDTVFRGAERDAWFNLLRLLRDHSNRELAAASTGRVGLVELLDQPHAYRGKLVTVAGQARRALYRTAPANQDGIEGYYQVVLRPAGGPSSPIILYCLQLPEQFPVGDGIAEDVQTTGFFFKNWAYSTGTEIHSYPTLLARTLAWKPPGAMAPAPVDAGKLALLLGGTAVVGLAVALAVYLWSGHRGRPVVAGGSLPSEGPLLAELARGETEPGVDEALKRLAAERLSTGEFPLGESSGETIQATADEEEGKTRS